MNQQTKIVILGSGFAGLYAYLGLHQRLHGQNISITLISDHDHFLFVPLIHEVVTGNLIPRGVRQDISVIPHCCLESFVMDQVTQIDFDKQQVTTKKGHKISYNYLISGLGSKANFFGIPGAAQHAFTLKNLGDAKRLKNHILDCFKEAENLLLAAAPAAKSLLRREGRLNFVIVGGGPTGVELAGELADICNHELAKAYPKLKGLAQIYLIHDRNKLIPQMNEYFTRKACQALARKKVNVLLNQRVTEVTNIGVQLQSNSIESKTVIWTAGVMAQEINLKAQKPLELDKQTKRIKVNNYLHLSSYPNAFMVGDQAWVCDKETGQPYPMRAQFAVREGKVAAENIKRLLRQQPLKEFFWHDQGFILSLGMGGALAEIHGMRFSGFIAWWIYRTAYLFNLIGWRAKLSTALSWTRGLFTSRDINRLK